MKNKKGFILSTYVYILLVFFLLLLGTMLAVLNNTRILSNKLKEQSSNTSGLVNKDFSFVLLGDKEILLRKGEKFIDPGFIIKSSGDRDLSRIVKVGGDLNNDVIGTYTLTYTATYNSVTKELTRIVKVVDDIATNYLNELYTYKSDENGLIKDDTADKNIRYTGNNVKNYVEFGNTNELWRIIGTFTVTTASGNTEKLMKIVRDAQFSTGMSWDSSASGINNGAGVNEWSQADLMTMLNTYYIGASTTCSYCSGDSQETCSNDCSSSVTQIGNTYTSMIEEVVWNTGAFGWGTTPVETAYNAERGTTLGKICTSGTYCNDSVTRTTTWQGKIGLIYPSDYGYASTDTSCRANINDYTNYPCKNTNWLHSGSYYWTLSPHAASDFANDAWNVDSSGYVGSGHAYYGYGVRPSVYLKSNVHIMGGDGSSTNPYRISM